jgi:hypothetical protein
MTSSSTYEADNLENLVARIDEPDVVRRSNIYCDADYHPQGKNLGLLESFKPETGYPVTQRANFLPLMLCRIILWLNENWQKTVKLVNKNWENTVELVNKSVGDCKDEIDEVVAELTIHHDEWQSQLGEVQSKNEEHSASVEYLLKELDRTKSRSNVHMQMLGARSNDYNSLQIVVEEHKKTLTTQQKQITVLRRLAHSVDEEGIKNKQICATQQKQIDSQQQEIDTLKQMFNTMSLSQSNEDVADDVVEQEEKVDDDDDVGDDESDWSLLVKRTAQQYGIDSRVVDSVKKLPPPWHQKKLDLAKKRLAFRGSKVSE